jgi:Holliday junction resolvasome RuvABC endonuclease subunit
MSIDPGTNFCGIVLSTMENNILVVHSTELINVTTSFKSEREKQTMELYGPRFLKILRITDRMKEIISDNNVDCLAVEGAYFNPTRPNAYASLIEVLFAVRNIVAYPLMMNVTEISSMLVKKQFSVDNMVKKGNSSKKDFVREGLIERKLNGTVVITKDIEQMSEHEVDATAIGYTYHKLYAPSLTDLPCF